jgi:hypothetical protein
MQLKNGNFCPLIKKDCKGIECVWFTQIRGTNPNTGNELDEWGCAIAWMPVLMVDHSQQQRQTGAAIESFRNEMVRSNEESARISIGLHSAPMKQIG